MIYGESGFNLLWKKVFFLFFLLSKKKNSRENGFFIYFVSFYLPLLWFGVEGKVFETIEGLTVSH